MSILLLTGALIVLALVVGILAGHYGWGRHLGAARKLHPDYLAGLDFLVSEQPDRALDMFLKLVDADSDTVETHFALGSLYRRRGEVERAIRIHQTLLARTSLHREHREQALLALARDYLRAGVLDRAEQLFQQVSDVPRLRPSALDALRGVYELQHEWRQALHAYRELKRAGAAPAAHVGAHYLCELASIEIERGLPDAAEQLLREVSQEIEPFARASLLHSQLAGRRGDLRTARQRLREALEHSPVLLQEQLPRLVELAGVEGEQELGVLVERAQRQGAEALKDLVFAACAAHLQGAPSLRGAIAAVFAEDAALSFMRQAEPDYDRLTLEIGALLAQAEKYRCSECGFSGRSFYWQCPACHAWDSFQPFAVVKLR